MVRRESGDGDISMSMRGPWGNENPSRETVGCYRLNTQVSKWLCLTVNYVVIKRLSCRGVCLLLRRKCSHNCAIVISAWNLEK